MSYDPNDYSTAGGEYETIGEDEMGAAPMMALRNPYQRQAPAARPVAQNLRFNPGMAALANQFRGAAAAPQGGALSVPAVRQIVREELRTITPFGQIPPRPQASEAMFPLGLGVVTFTAATDTTLTLIATPQRAFRGERLILEIAKNGPGVQTTLVTLADFKVGDVSQKIGGGVLPAAVFAADAFGVRLMLDGAVPGVQITLTFNIGTAPAPGESISVSGAIIGRATLTEG